MKNSKQNTLILANLILYIMEAKTLQAIMNLAIWHVLNFTCKYFINIFCVRFLSLGQNTLLIHFKEGKLYYGAKFQGFKPWIICLWLWVMTRQKNITAEKGEAITMQWCYLMISYTQRGKEKAMDNTHNAQALTVVPHTF